MEALIVIGIICGVAYCAEVISVRLQRELPTVQEQKLIDERDAYTSEGMEEVNKFLAPYTTTDEGRPILPPVFNIQVDERPWCGCASLGEACRVCAPHWFEHFKDKRG